MNTLRKLLKDESGATAIEYGLIAALVSVVIIGVLGTLGDNLLATFTTVSDGLGGAAGAPPPQRTRNDSRHRRPSGRRCRRFGAPHGRPAPSPSITLGESALRDQNHDLPTCAHRGRLRSFAAATEGSTLIEYALIASLIAMVVLGALREVGAQIIGLPLAAIIAALS